MNRLHETRVLITGGTTGLGLAIALRFADQGARTVITGRNLHLGAEAERTLRERGDAWFVQADAGETQDNMGAFLRMNERHDARHCIEVHARSNWLG